jgi:hypothetical protein
MVGDKTMGKKSSKTKVKQLKFLVITTFVSAIVKFIIYRRRSRNRMDGISTIIKWIVSFWTSSGYGDFQSSFSRCIIIVRVY